MMAAPDPTVPKIDLASELLSFLVPSLMQQRRADPGSLSTLQSARATTSRTMPHSLKLCGPRRVHTQCLSAKIDVQRVGSLCDAGTKLKVSSAFEGYPVPNRSSETVAEWSSKPQMPLEALGDVGRQARRAVHDHRRLHPATRASDPKSRTAYETVRAASARPKAPDRRPRRKRACQEAQAVRTVRCPARSLD